MKPEKSVLLIDDDELYCQLQSIELKEMNVWDQIICIDSREEALSFIKGCLETNSTPEFIFMDFNMGMMSLEEFVSELRALSYTATSFPKLIVTSAHFNKASLEQLKLLGLDEYLTKPITTQKISLILSKINGEV